MNKYLVITIDVEPDCSPNWTYSSPLRFTGVSEGIAKKLQPLFNKYDIAPTYLINNVVLEHDGSCAVLKSLPGRYELGTHLHPEFIEPQKTKFDYAGQKGAANCCFYPPEVELQKIKNISSLFTDKFNYAATCFRAGRFSAGNNTIASLTANGYLVDTSITPHVLWNDKTREKAVDFTSAREQPYFMDPHNMLAQSSVGHMLQVPITIAMRKTKLLQELKRSYFGLRHRYQTEKPLWLRPVFSSLNDFVSLTWEYTEQYGGERQVVFNMMFHNVEVMPGLSPYTRSASQCAAYLYQLEEYFRYCSKNNIQSLTLRELYDRYKN